MCGQTLGKNTMFLNHIYNLFVLICISIIYTSKIFHIQVISCFSVQTYCHCMFHCQKKRPDTSFLTKDLVKNKSEMVFFSKIHPETVQSKTCKGPFLANYAGKLDKPFCQRIFSLHFCQRIFSPPFCQSIFSLPFCQRLQPFCQRLP